MLKTGKLDSDLLKKLVFDKITYRSDDVKVRPGIGEDCAVVDFEKYDCVMSVSYTHLFRRTETGADVVHGCHLRA